MIQGKEVPPSAAEGFLKDVDQDPKFQRFHERMACIAEINHVTAEKERMLGALRDERKSLSLPDPRVLGLALLLALPLLVLSAALPWWQGRAAVILLAIAALVVDEVKARRAKHEREVRLAEITEGLEAIERDATKVLRQLEARIVEIDHEAASSIKIIDPATFGAPAKKLEEKRSS